MPEYGAERWVVGVSVVGFVLSRLLVLQPELGNALEGLALAGFCAAGALVMRRLRREGNALEGRAALALPIGLVIVLMLSRIDPPFTPLTAALALPLVVAEILVFRELWRWWSNRTVESSKV